MFLVVATLIVGHALALPDAAQCNEQGDHAALLQVNKDVVKSHDDKSMGPKPKTIADRVKAPEIIIDRVEAPDSHKGNTQMVENTKETPTHVIVPQEPKSQLDMIDSAEGAYAVQHGTQTSAHGKTRSTTEVLLVCTFVIVTLSAGWLVFWQMSKSGVEMGTLKLILLCCSFGACSWAMNVLNKTLVKDLKCPTLVTAAQMLMTVIGALIMVRDKLNGDKVQVLKWSFIPLIFCGMLVSSFFTYQYLTLSLLMVIRNLGPLVTLPIESVVMAADKRPYVTNKMILALLVVLASTFLYSQKIEVSTMGVMLAMLNMVLAITDRVAQRRLLTSECKDLTTETCMFLNNSIGMIPCFILAFVFGEIDKVDLKVWFGSLTTVLLVLSGVIGTGICYFAIAVQREISATSFMVLQNAVRMLVVLFGVVCFFDPIGWPYQVMGLVLSFVGAFAYGLAQLSGQAELKAIKAAEEQAMKAKSAEAAHYVNEPSKEGK